MCGTSQRFPPARFSGGLGLGILLAFKVGAGGETRTLMSVTSPDFESGAYTNFATPAQCGFNGQAILVAAATHRQPGWHSPLLVEKVRESSGKSSPRPVKRLFAKTKCMLYNCQAGLDRRFAYPLKATPLANTVLGLCRYQLGEAFADQTWPRIIPNRVF